MNPDVEPYRNRHDAGRRLAEQLLAYADRSDVVVLALPRGGVPVAYEIAKRLRAPLDVFVVRKLGVPGRTELAMGAIASDGTNILNSDILGQIHISRQAIDEVIRKERRELARREQLYRDHRAPANVRHQTVLLVDDGLATGASMRVAVQALRSQNPARIIVAVPVAPLETCAELQKEVDGIVCPVTPASFHAVGEWYEDFAQTTDEEVRRLLAGPP